MENYKLEQELNVFGFPVKTFPDGIEEAFDSLIKLFPADNTRPFYGISECTPAGMVYVAATLLKPEEKPEKYDLQAFYIEKGDYLAVTVKDWRTKTHTIKSIFEKMVADPRCNQAKPCVEIYLNDEEMLCLVKALDPAEAQTKQFIAEARTKFEKTARELQEQFVAFEPEEINLVPFNGSWTAGQLAEHLIISNSGFVEIITGPVTETARKPDELVPRIKADFLNFNVKMESPKFVYPQNRQFQKYEVLEFFKEIQELIIKPASP